jgi:hypothetical protein
MTDFSVYLTSIGNDNYQMFIKNNRSETDFIRIIIGYTEMISGKRVGKVANSWIISPLQPDSEKVFIQQINKRMVYRRRLWVAFEAVKRSKPKNKTTECFIALSPSMSSWRKTIGADTYFELKVIDSLRTVEKSAELQQIA